MLSCVGLGGWAAAMSLLSKLAVYASLNAPVSEQADAAAWDAAASAKSPITAPSTRDEIRDQLDDLEHLIENAEERIVEQDAALQQLSEEVNEQAEGVKEIEDRVAPTVRHAVSELMQVECDKTPLDLPLDLISEATDAVNDLPPQVIAGASILPWNVDLLHLAANPRTPAAERGAACVELIVGLDLDKFEYSVARQQQNLTRTSRRLEAQRARLESARNVLSVHRARQTALRKGLHDAPNPRDSIKGDLKLIIAILGLFSLLIMVVVRRFSIEVQKEWVASGQVIQFMTVTIIISAVLALGLSQVLTQEILGTLLGAIGGYVLSQGIGRSATDKIQKVEGRMEELLRRVSADGREAGTIDRRGLVRREGSPAPDLDGGVEK